MAVVLRYSTSFKGSGVGRIFVCGGPHRGAEGAEGRGTEGAEGGSFLII